MGSLHPRAVHSFTRALASTTHRHIRTPWAPQVTTGVTAGLPSAQRHNTHDAR